MYTIIKKFPKNLIAAIKLIKKSQLKPINRTIKNIVITGMGSSGIAGNMVKKWVIDKIAIPLEINHDYNLPAYVNGGTLLIVISYSGNTQETIEALQIGIKNQASICIITSGGKLQVIAQTHNIQILALPKYLPPRACIDHTIVQLLFILYFYQIIRWEFVEELEAAVQLIMDKQEQMQKEAEQVALKIQDSLPIIYTISPYEAIAIRLRQQLNENSKQLCWHHVIPELAHNEIVGWETNHQNLSVIILTSHIENDRLKQQEEIIQKMIENHTKNITILYAQGQTSFICSLYLIHLSDWISFYLAQKKGVDPTEVRYIDQIKAALYADK